MFIKNETTNSRYVRDGMLIKQFDIDRNCDYMFMNYTDGRGFKEYIMCGKLQSQYDD
jgi:hypothetical protein